MRVRPRIVRCLARAHFPERSRVRFSLDGWRSHPGAPGSGRLWGVSHPIQLRRRARQRAKRRREERVVVEVSMLGVSIRYPKGHRFKTVDWPE